MGPGIRVAEMDLFRGVYLDLNFPIQSRDNSCPKLPCVYFCDAFLTSPELWASLLKPTVSLLQGIFGSKVFGINRPQSSTRGTLIMQRRACL